MMAGCWQRIFMSGEPWIKKPIDSLESNFQIQSVERILRRIESTANVELVITALELIEHAQNPEAFHGLVKGWEGGPCEGMLREMRQALGG
jgi:hypothetical protein